MKTLDMADKYDPLSYQDEYTEGHVDSTPTIKIQVPTFLPKVIVSDEGEEVYDLDGTRDTIPCPPPYTETRYPGVGLLLTFGTGIIFWGTLAYLLFR